MAASPTPPDLILSSLLRAAWQKAGITKTELASRANMLRSVVSECLTGSHPISETTFSRLIEALGYEDPLSFLLDATALLVVTRDGPRRARLRFKALMDHLPVPPKDAAKKS